MPKNSYSIQSLEAAFTVLECFIKSAGKPLRWKDIHDLTQLGTNRTYRILSTLSDHGYLEKDKKTSEYCLGPNFFILGELYRKNKVKLPEASSEILQELAATTGEYALLTVRYGDDEMISIEGIQGKFAIQAHSDTGIPYPLNIGGAGRLFLLGMPEPERSRVLDTMKYPRYTEKTVTDRLTMEKDLQLAARQGYFVAEGDWEIGVNGIGAPVIDETGQTIAVIGILIPSVRFTEEYKLNTINSVVEASMKLSRKLGYRGKSLSQVDSPSSEAG